MSAHSRTVVLLLVLLVLSLSSAYLGGAQEASGGIQVIVSQMGAVVEDFSVTPQQALPGEIITFSVRVRNVGELQFEIAGTSRVEISRAGNTVRTLYFTPPSENVQPNEEVTLTVEWTVEDLPADNYRATAIVDYDGYSASSSEGFSILQVPAELPPEVYPEFEAIETATSPPASPMNPAVFSFTILVLREMTVRVAESVGESMATVTQYRGLPSFLFQAIPAVPYKYLGIDVSGIPENVVEGVTLSFAVERSWLTGNTIDEASVRMYRLSEAGWGVLPTSKTGENTTHVFYSAESPGFSFFGIGGLVLPEEEYLEWEFRPVLVEALQGETRFLSLRIRNSGDEQLTGVEVSLSGSAAEMVTVVPGRFTLAPLEEMTLVAVLAVPGGATPGDLWLRLTAQSGEAIADTVALVRIKPFPEDRPAVTRTVELDRAEMKTAVMLNVVNSRRALASFEVVEDIPKWLAQDAGEVSSEDEHEILEPDPMIRWVLSALRPYEKRSISYSVDVIPDDVSGLLYWPIRQLSAVFEVSAELIRVMEVYSESMALGGTGRINITLLNTGENVMAARVRLELPPGWEVVPAEIVVTLSPSVSTAIAFTVGNPPHAEPGLYTGQLRLSYGGEDHVRGVAILVIAQGEIPIFVPLIVIICALVILFILARRVIYRGKRRNVMTVLEQVKRE